MKKGRLEAFSDGVIAIIITIMVLELKAPHGDSWSALSSLSPVFLSYVLSFTYVGIYWNNHHHLLQACREVTGAMLWANLHLLFWLSLLPLATAWMGENHFSSRPVAVYGAILVFSALAYYFLQRLILRQRGPESHLAAAIGSDWKGKLSPLLYMIGIALSFWQAPLAGGIYVLVALLWLIPDRRIERALVDEPPE